MVHRHPRSSARLPGLRALRTVRDGARASKASATPAVTPSTLGVLTVSPDSPSSRSQSSVCRTTEVGQFVAKDSSGWLLSMRLTRRYLTIVGRRKDIIIRGGESLSAKEIEDLLFEHPSVSEVAVVGMPDPVMVKRICAFVVPGSELSPGVAGVVCVSYYEESGEAKTSGAARSRRVAAKDSQRQGTKFKLRDAIRAKPESERAPAG